MIQLRQAKTEELGISMKIIEEARAYLKEQGSDQWQDGYPDLERIRMDIEMGKGYLLETDDDGQAIPAGYLCLDFDGEPAYREIDGAWQTKDAPYAVIHRYAIRRDMRDRKLAMAGFAAAETICRERGVGSIRVDTQDNNGKMKHLLNKAGYRYCGWIQFQNGPKIAFEKIL